MVDDYGIWEIPWQDPQGVPHTTIVVAQTMREAAQLFYQSVGGEDKLGNEVLVNGSDIKKLRVDHGYVVGSYGGLDGQRS